MNSLKARLLDRCEFLDCEYLDMYVRLIERNRRTPKLGASTNSHHIIPKAWYRLNKHPVDNSITNLVNLRYRDHVLAHYYLCLCTVGKLRYANQLALFLLVRRNKLNQSEKLLVQGLPLYNNIYEDYIKHKRSGYRLY